MKKLLLTVIPMIALVVVTGCHSKKENLSENTESESVKSESVAQQVNDAASDNLNERLAKAGIEDLDAYIEKFFTEVYDKEYYNDYDFIEKQCTKKLVNNLKEEDVYDGEDGYATWKFRSDAQDGPTNDYKLVKFVPEGDGWYKYDFIDMGIRGSHRIKVITEITPEGVVELYIDELE